MAFSFSQSKVYTANISNPLAKYAGVSVNNTVGMYIDNYNKTLRLKSILWEMRVRRDNEVNMNLQAPETMSFSLRVGEDASLMIANPIIRTTNPNAATITTGRGFYMYKPGQVFFDSFFISETIYMLFSISNYDSQYIWNYYSSFIFEVEELS